MTHTVAAFYKFVAIAGVQSLRDQVSAYCRQHNIKGTVLLAREGFNATVAGERHALHDLIEFLQIETCAGFVDVKWSEASKAPFRRLKVKIKPEIVTFGVTDANPTERPGCRVSAQDWNALISDPSVVVIDTRNAYEVGVGTFSNSVNPNTRAFSEFAKFVNENLSPEKTSKVAMFCTGGIRCEKASAFMLGRGFKDVYQLDGGILKYLETIPREQSLFEGECFVFDERVALDHGVVEGTYKHCTRCGFPMPTAVHAGICATCRET